MEDITSQERKENPKSESPKENKLKKYIPVIATALVVSLITGGASYVLFSPQGTNDTKVAPSEQAAETVQNEESTDATAAESMDYYKVLARGYPFDTGDVIITELGVPNRLQAISISSIIRDPGYTNLLANKFNEEMGRWIMGDANLPSNRMADISILHIGDDWLAETNSSETDPFSYVEQEYRFTTPEEKAASLKELMDKTSKCTGDQSTGFVISELLNVCYSSTLVRQSYGSYSPVLNLEGYGEINGRQYVLFGWMRLIDDTAYEDDEANKLGDEFLAGTIPDQTQDIINEYVNALKNTTITRVESPNL